MSDKILDDDLTQPGALQNSTAMRPARQSYFVPPSSSMTSGIAIHDGNAGQLRRTLDWPASDHPAATPKETLRERLRRPLLILFPMLLAAVGAAYYLAEAPYISTDDPFVRAAK